MSKIISQIISRVVKKKKDNEIIIVYQMGKVAPLSIYKSLSAIERNDIYHVHRLNPVNIKKVRREHVSLGVMPQDERKAVKLYNKMKKGSSCKTIKIISLFREPISRNISAFFQNKHIYLDDHEISEKFNMDKISDIFLRKYNHNIPLEWFDNELKLVTGVDIYTHKFPIDKGYQIIKSGCYEILLMRYNLNDKQKRRVLSDFLGIQIPKIIRTNISSQKEYAETYSDFIKSMKFSESYVDKMFNSKYVKHFFSEGDILKLRKKWLVSSKIKK